jgi:Dpy-30 motif
MADIDYLKATVNESLIQGFQVLSRLQPDDPIDFLGKWLLRRADALELAKQVSIEWARIQQGSGWTRAC